MHIYRLKTALQLSEKYGPEFGRMDSERPENLVAKVFCQYNHAGLYP